MVLSLSSLMSSVSDCARSRSHGITLRFPNVGGRSFFCPKLSGESNSPLIVAAGVSCGYVGRWDLERQGLFPCYGLGIFSNLVLFNYLFIKLQSSIPYILLFN